MPWPAGPQLYVYPPLSSEHILRLWAFCIKSLGFAPELLPNLLPSGPVQSPFPLGLAGEHCTPLVRPHFPVLRSLEIMLISKLRSRVPKCASRGTWNLKSRPTAAEGRRNHKMHNFLKNHKKQQKSDTKRDPEGCQKSRVGPSWLSCGILLASLVLKLLLFCFQVLPNLSNMSPKRPPELKK